MSEKAWLFKVEYEKRWFWGKTRRRIRMIAYPSPRNPVKETINLVDLYTYNLIFVKSTPLKVRAYIQDTYTTFYAAL